MAATILVFQLDVVVRPGAGRRGSGSRPRGRLGPGLAAPLQLPATLEICPGAPLEPFDDGCRLNGQEVGRDETMSEVDKVRLSVRERQQLAAIQAMVEAGDPELARTLTGHKGSVQAALRRTSQMACVWAKTCFERRWLGPLLFVLGFALIFGTIAGVGERSGRADGGSRARAGLPLLAGAQGPSRSPPPGGAKRRRLKRPKPNPARATV
jgi:Protein of unknown function (DUF3040)